MIYKKFIDSEIFKKQTNITYEYNIEDKDLNYCIVEIDGRFPFEKYALNKVCREMVHILDGCGQLYYIKDNKIESIQLRKDDVVMVMPNELYYWEGKMRLGVSCTPAWYPEQHETHNFKILGKTK